MISANAISVIIPTLNAGEHLSRLVRDLRRQGMPPLEIIVVDSSSQDGTPEEARRLGCSVRVIQREEFDHGAARNLGAGLSSGGILVFLTQDALPAHGGFLRTLTQSIRTGAASAAYARQLPQPGARPSEAFLRHHNYPLQSEIRSSGKTPRRLRDLMFSNAASAIDRKVFVKQGGFAEGLPTNEDMLLCARLLERGEKVAYEADARVFHSHSYGLGEQFRRYFDTGVFMAQNRQDLGCTPGAGDGARYALDLLRFLLSNGHLAHAPWALAEVGVRFFGYHSGLRWNWLPAGMRRFLSRNPAFWQRTRLGTGNGTRQGGAGEAQSKRGDQHGECKGPPVQAGRTAEVDYGNR